MERPIRPDRSKGTHSEAVLFFDIIYWQLVLALNAVKFVSENQIQNPENYLSCCSDNRIDTAFAGMIIQSHHQCICRFISPNQNWIHRCWHNVARPRDLKFGHSFRYLESNSEFIFEPAEVPGFECATRHPWSGGLTSMTITWLDFCA